MSVKPWIPLLMIPCILLQACAPARPPLAVGAQPSPGVDPRAAIQKSLSRICPKTLTPAELERLAKLAETQRDPEVTWAAGKLDLMDRESGVCRGP